MFKHLMLTMVLFNSCIIQKPIGDEEVQYIRIENRYIELVIDDYDNYYLKQKIRGKVIYTPFTFPMDDEKIPRIYEAGKLITE